MYIPRAPATEFRYRYAAVCCSQHVAVRCSVCCSAVGGCGIHLSLQPRNFDIGARQCVAVCCSQHVAVRYSACCSVLGGCGIHLSLQPRNFDIGTRQCVAVCCSALQCVLQCARWVWHIPRAPATGFRYRFVELRTRRDVTSSCPIAVRLVDVYMCVCECVCVCVYVRERVRVKQE